MPDQTRPPDRLTAIRLAARTPCDPRTAARWLAGAEPKGSYLRGRLAEAARELGLARAA